MDKKSKILWGLFISSMAILAVDAFFIVGDTECPHFFEKFKLYFPAMIIFMHIIVTLKAKRALAFISVSSITGLIFEIVGTRYGNIVMTGYCYNDNYYDIFFLGVPLLIPIFWTVFIYTAYSITNSFLLWKKQEKPSILNSPIKKDIRASRVLPRRTWGLPRLVKALYKLIILDAFIVLSIDLLMDPVMVSLGNWQWDNAGFYFNIPTLNFIGWFVIALIASAIFRTIEYYFPLKNQLHYSIYLIPLIGYSSLYIIFSLMALQAELYSLVTINSLIMLPIIILNIKKFINYRKLLARPSL